MSFFPIFVDLSTRNVLIVGGGKVALRKARVILQFTQNVTVVAPNVIDDIKLLEVNICEREFNVNDLSDKFLVITTTDNKLLNQEVLNICNSMGILCNSATSNKQDNCIFPSIVRDGDITIGISTNGKSPTVSRKIRENIEKSISLREYDALIRSRRR